MLPFAGNAGTMQYYSTRPGAVVSVSHQTKGVSPEIKPNFHSPSGPSSRSHRDQECTSTFYCQGCGALIPLGNNLHTVDTCMCGNKLFSEHPRAASFLRADRTLALFPYGNRSSTSFFFLFSCRCLARW